MTPNNTELESAGFAVLDRPVCVRDPFLSDINSRFLTGLDSDFFFQQALLLVPADTSLPRATEDDQRSALMLRIVFGMALETLFAVLGAVIQAPHCVFGWLSLYKNHELFSLVRLINNDQVLKTVVPFRPPSWQNIAEHLLMPLAQNSPDLHRDLSMRFARTWRALAEIFLDPERAREYNSLKHSFRVRASAFNVVFRQGSGEPDLLRSESPLGHAFPYLKKNKGSEFDYSVSHAAFALEPHIYLAGLKVIGNSINNAIEFARASSKVGPADYSLLYPADVNIFEVVTAADKTSSPIQSISYGGTSIPERCLSEREIFAIYEE